MSPTATRFFKLGVTSSIVIAVACVCAGIRATARSPITGFEQGLPIGNKRFTVYRHGADFRIAPCVTIEVLLSPGASPAALHNAAAWNEAWGRPQHWLSMPHIDVSLWWPMALSGVLPVVWLVRRRRQGYVVGFPVGATRRAT